MRVGLWLGIGAGLLLAACAQEEVTITIETSIEEPGPSVADALVRHLGPQGITVQDQENADPDTILPNVRAGLVDFGIVEEPAQRQPGLSTVAPLYPSILHALHRKEREVGSFPDLIRGQRVYAGPIGGTAWRLLQQLSGDYMISDVDYTVLPDPWTAEPDVYFILGGLLGDDQRSALSDYELYSFGDAQRMGFGTQAEGLALKYPNIRPFILPESVYGSFNPEPVLTIATRTVLVTREDFDPDLTYRIARELFENAHAIAAEYHLVMNELNHKVDADALALPLHPGARVYVDKDEPTVVERYAEVVGVGLTIVAALGSGLLAVWRMGKTRRKDRIDVYYQRVLAIRGQIQPDLKTNNTRELTNKVKAIQEEVFGLLVAERLNVDESLTLFLDLSNRVLSEIAAIDETELTRSSR
ncbi:MAG: TAXI family TRAP transporter solute-binding subunit [Pseudomonadota bacterium]